MELTMFGLRHKATGEFMPEMGNGGGYARWSPGGGGGGPEGALAPARTRSPRIRLLPSLGDARDAQAQWARGGGDMHPGGASRDAGRDVEDLEVVEFTAFEAAVVRPLGTMDAKRDPGPLRRYSLRNNGLDNLPDGTWPLFAVVAK